MGFSLAFWNMFGWQCVPSQKGEPAQTDSPQIIITSDHLDQIELQIIRLRHRP